MSIALKTTSALLVAGFTLTACAEGSMSTGPNANRNQGALVGAALGAAAGQAIGGDTQGTLIGAAVGAAAGGGVGVALDRQEQELRRDLANSGVGIQNTGDQLVVTLPESISFATDSATVAPGFQNQLSVVANSLRNYPGSSVRITGHTDSSGEASYNQRLSERRAQAVANVLVANGVSQNRLVVSGAGETQPIASNGTSSGRAQNRRVELVITPNG
ncbi:OmpA family protein [Pontivivens nitratireducens]|jgi:outer membrane protein OmpA-like peptidoglycan-associated protein|uniref:OmpA family protein n=1 Tax=Pontivivens nitratireducens TaxID=2758038 RepID=A0A6G7VH98_9RHOB|nr:OmpA family protein [Pontibrevibacter nitratireducens]QIK39322.1 OmpA family protein [Pontibrevibacter nitratireducens]